MAGLVREQGRKSKSRDCPRNAYETVILFSLFTRVAELWYLRMLAAQLVLNLLQALPFGLRQYEEREQHAQHAEYGEQPVQ